MDQHNPHEARIHELYTIAAEVWTAMRAAEAAFSDLPEIDQENEAGTKVQNAIDNLENAHCHIEQAIEYLQRLIP